jgi:hypothetical protein
MDGLVVICVTPFAISCRVRLFDSVMPRVVLVQQSAETVASFQRYRLRRRPRRR